MPEQEFDLYLSLLVKLLRLSPEQKTSIEAELRDHFEERFEALVRSGMPRDEAIRRTLDEFGDVAGLAHEFTHLSRKHIRRRIMQGTMATAGVAAAVVIWATLFRGPEPAVGPTPNLVAQDQPNEPATNPPPADSVEKPSPSEVRTAAMFDGGGVDSIDPGRFLPEKLTQTIPIEFQGTPLRDVLNYIGEVAGIQILIDTASLAEAGITGDEEVSFVHTVPVHIGLDVILSNVNQVELAWIQDSEVIRITTQDKADNTETTQHYNVRDLLQTGHTRDKLIEVVQAATEGPWEAIDGIGGSISGYGDLLVVKQSQRTQLDVACTLAGLRSKSLVRMVGVLQSHYRINAAMDSATSIEFQGTPIRDVMNYVSEIHGIPIALDIPVLSEAGITGDEEVSLVVNGIKLNSALRLLLENINQVELATVIRDGALWVTTKDAAENFLQTVIYDVADITGNDPHQIEQLVSVLENETEGPWEDIDGIGGLICTPTDGLLVCRQPMKMQVAVYTVIDAIRASLSDAGGDRSSITQYETKLETRFYRMDAEAAADVARLIPALIEPGTWRVDLTGAGDAEIQAMIGTIHTLAAGRMLLKLESGTVVESVEQHRQIGGTPAPDPDTSQPSPPLTGAPAAGTSEVVVIPQAVLIITHKPAVLRQVSKLLHSLLAGDGNWTSQGADGKVKFIAPGYQEGTWKGSLGSGGIAPVGAFGGGGGGFGGGGPGGGGGFFSIEFRRLGLDPAQPTPDSQ